MWKELKEELVSFQPNIFLQFIEKKQITNFQEFFLFATSAMNDNFNKAIVYLSSEQTLTLNEWKKLQKKGFFLIAITIDGDYLLADAEQTVLMPVSLIKSDAESFSFPVIDFFIHFEEKTLTSPILGRKAE